MKKIAAVIVTYNNAGMLAKLLADVLGQTCKPDEVLVVDNASRDATTEVVKGFLPSVRYVRFEQNLGSAGGYHEGIRLASLDNDAIWLLDDDVAMGPNALEALVKGLEAVKKKEKVGAVRSWCTQECPFSVFRKTSSFAWRGTMITRQTVETIGLPKTEYFLYYDDIEYAWRMVKNGFAIYWIPASRVWEQRFDDKQRVRIGTATVSIYKDKARLYYAFRNQVNLCLLYQRWWCLLRTLLYAVKVVSMLFFTGDAELKGKIHAIAQGINDGFKKRLGRNDAYSL